MSTRFEPRVEHLLAALSDGLASEAGQAVRAELGLSSEATDRDVARSLVQILSAISVTDAARRPPDPPEAAGDVDAANDDEPPELPAASVSADASLVGRVEAFGRDAIPVEQVEELPTLLGLLRGGMLRQRRAVLRRLGELWDDFAGREQRLVAEQLASLRDVEIEAELVVLRTRMGGAIGRHARVEQDEWSKLVADLVPRLDAFWDGQTPAEPIADLPGDRRAHLLLHARDLPDVVVAHLCAVLDGSDGVSSREARRELLESLRYAGDPRLVPTLIELVDSGSSDIALDAVRALRRIEDPRVVPALIAIYERSVTDPAKAVVAGALGAHGDRRGLDYVRRLAEREDPDLELLALEALETLGGKEDTEQVAARLTGSAAAAAQAVHTLHRIGDRRALRPLSDLEESTRVGAVRGAIDDARTAIIARLELRGEDVREEETRAIRLETEDRPQTSLGLRFRAFRLYAVGVTLIAFGVLGAGIARLERAGALRAGWGRPWIVVAMTHARKRRHAQALAAFRRAIETDRELVERNPLVVRQLAQTFLRRAEQVERDGRHDVARGLLGEVLDLDLRRAPSAVRFELQRRRRALQRAS